MKEALVFTRTKHRANRLAEHLIRAGVNADRIHGNRSQSQRTAALAAFKSGTHRVLVATDIAARGIDVEALGHVVNFDVPMVPEDYIHRVGRTARAEATGEAFTFVSPQEEADLRAIESAIGKRLPRVTVPDFDYTARPQQKLEIPLAERIAAIRKMKSEQRARSAMKNARANGPKAGASHGARSGPSAGPKSSSPHGPGAARPRGPGGPGARWAWAWSEPRRPIVGRQGEPVTIDDIRALLDYHYWARDRLLAAVEPLTDEQRTRDMGSSFRSIHDTLVHLFAAEWAWHSRWNGVSPTALSQAGEFPDLATLRARWTELERQVREHVDAAGEEGLHRVCEYKSLAGARRTLAALADGAARRESRQLSPRPGHYDAAADWGRAGQEPRPDRLLPRTGVTIGRWAVVAAIVLAGGCDTPCAFRIVTRIEPGVRRVACCGAADIQDVDVPDEPDLAIDISQVALPDRVGGQDLWLTRTDCAAAVRRPVRRAGHRAPADAEMPVLTGPVSPGRVSPRTPCRRDATGCSRRRTPPTPPPTTIGLKSASGAPRARGRPSARDGPKPC